MVPKIQVFQKLRQTDTPSFCQINTSDIKVCFWVLDLQYK